jgi:hypothetical protein
MENICSVAHVSLLLCIYRITNAFVQKHLLWIQIKIAHVLKELSKMIIYVNVHQECISKIPSAKIVPKTARNAKLMKIY